VKNVQWISTFLFSDTNKDLVRILTDFQVGDYHILELNRFKPYGIFSLHAISGVAEGIEDNVPVFPDDGNTLDDSS
jgi:hypothetical protein